ncbi:beta-N-acetylglucosaminidase [Fusarium fujikuroi]|nr:beta-N-acetylglucosaminidase [Fusarium fujikuroi]
MGALAAQIFHGQPQSDRALEEFRASASKTKTRIWSIAVTQWLRDCS